MEIVKSIKQAILDHSMHDGKPRKLAIVILTQLLLTGSAAITGWFPAVAGVYPTLAGALVAVLGLYLTGTVATTHVLTKNLGADPLPVPEFLKPEEVKPS